MGALDDLLGAGASKKSVELGAARQRVQSNLDKILASGASDSVKKKAEKTANQKGAPLKGLMKALQVLDIPRAAIVSGVREIVDIADGGENTHGFVKGIKEHEGVGDWLAGTDLPINVKRALGFLGDVALDPLTYVAPQAKLAGGADDVARKLLGEGAEALGEQGAKAAAAKAMRDGVGALSKDELAAIGATGGLKFNVPLTGRIGRALHLAPELKQVDLIPQGVTSTATRPLRAVRTAAKDTTAFDAPSNRIGNEGPLRQMMRSGDPERAVAGLRTLDASRKARGFAKFKEREWGGSLEGLLRPWYKRKMGQELVRLLEAPSPVREAQLLAEGLDVGAVRGFLEQIRSEANAIAGEDFIREIQHYFPHITTKEFREARGRKGYKGEFGKAGPEFQRAIRANGEFLGVTLETGSIDEIERIGREVLGRNYVDIFEGDPAKVLSAYVHIVSKRVGEKVVQRDLGGMGLVVPKQAISLAGDVAQAGEDMGRRLGNAEALRGEAAVQREAGDVANEVVRAGAALNAPVVLDAAVAFDDVAGLERRLNGVLRDYTQVSRRIDQLKRQIGKGEGRLIAGEMGLDDLLRQEEELRRAAEELFEGEAFARAATPGQKAYAGADDLRLKITKKIEKTIGDVEAIEDRLADLHADRLEAERLLASMQHEFDSTYTLYENVDEAAQRARAEVERRIGELPARRQESARAVAADLFARAERLERVASTPRNDNADLVARLLARADHQEALAAAAGERALEAEAALGRLRLSDMQEQAIETIRDGIGSWKDLGLSGRIAPDEIADFLTRMSEVAEPKGFSKFLHWYDKSISLWKAYAILTPGFHFRNTFGGAFNMYVDGVQTRNVRRFLAAWSGKGTPEDRAFVEQLRTLGVMTGGQAAHEITPAITGVGKANPLSTNFAPLQFSRRRGENVENFLRGAHGFHVLAEGGTAEEALNRVIKFHFDYDDLSDFERGVARRLIPFWTWTSRNLPLQLEMAIRRPANYKRYLDVKRNVELGTDEEDVVPSYFGELGGIRLPFSLGEGRGYLTPDVPFVNALSKPLDPGQLAASVSPVLKTPVELWAGKQAFSDIPFKQGLQATPKSWGFLMPFLSTIGKARKDEEGQWVMSDKDAYLVEQFLPVLGRMRRLAPSEKRYQERQMSTWLSFMFGVGLRSNTPQAQESELRRRDDALRRTVRTLKDLKVIEEES